MMKKLKPVVILWAFAALMGCASTPQAHFYTLSPETKPAVAGASYSISVGPVSIPAVVDRPQIVVRSGSNQVAFDEFNRWGSPLQNEIARIVAENLASILGVTSVTLFPQASASAADFRVVIDVLRFDSVPGQGATLDALWTVRSLNKNLSRTGRTTVFEPVQANGFAALVSAHSRGLGRLSGDIAGVIQTLSLDK